MNYGDWDVNDNVRPENISGLSEREVVYVPSYAHIHLHRDSCLNVE